MERRAATVIVLALRRTRRLPGTVYFLLASLVMVWGAGSVPAANDAPQSASISYYRDKERGWWWKEPEPETVAPEETPASPPPEAHPEQAPEARTAVAAKPAELRPFSPAWLREQLPLLRDRAIENPTDDNIRSYFRMQQYAMNLAEQFAAGAQRVVLSDPSLDENNRRPLSTYGAQVVDSVAREETERAAARVASYAGIWYFFRSDCPYCAAENPVLERLQKRLGLVVLPISLDGRQMPEGHFTRFVPDKGHAKKLGVSQTPTLFLVKPGGGGYALVSEGLVTDEELIERMVIAAHTAGWLSDEEFNATRPRRPILASGAQGTPEADSDLEELLSPMLSTLSGGSGGL